MSLHKVINGVCLCGVMLIQDNREIAVLLPCEHLVHYSCLRKVGQNCPFCKEKVKSTKRERDIAKEIKNNKPDNHQIYIDMLSLHIPDCYSSLHKYTLMQRLHEIIGTFAQLSLQITLPQAQKLILQLFANCNIHLDIKGKIADPNQRVVFVANHTRLLDGLAMVAATQCGILINSAMFKDIPIMKYVVKNLDLVYVQRGGKGGNVIEQMRNYLKNTHRRLLVFPEGMLSHHHSINRFRTGGFQTGYPIQPVVIKFHNNIYSEGLGGYFLRLMSQDKITISLEFLDVEEPPFNTARIENIRRKMAKVGGFVLSRVSNRLVKD